MLSVLPAPRVIDQDVPHNLCGDGEEVGPILPFDFLLSSQAQIGFVNQRRGPKCVAVALSLDITMRDAPQLVIDQRSQFVERRPVALAPLNQQSG